MTTTPNIRAILDDPNVLTVSAIDAGQVLPNPISRTTVWRRVKANGELLDGVPVFRSGRTVVVATAHLRRRLGIPDPTPNEGENQ